MCSCTAFDYKTAVETDQHFDPFMREEVVPDADKRANEIAQYQQIGQPCRVKHDIAVIRQEKRSAFDVRVYLLAVAQIVQADTFRSPQRKNLKERKHEQQVANK